MNFRRQVKHEPGPIRLLTLENKQLARFHFSGIEAILKRPLVVSKRSIELNRQIALRDANTVCIFYDCLDHHHVS